MPIRIYGKVRKTINGKKPNPFYCDWRPDASWETINITTASPEWGRVLLEGRKLSDLAIRKKTPSCTSANTDCSSSARGK